MTPEVAPAATEPDYARYEEPLIDRPPSVPIARVGAPILDFQGKRIIGRWVCTPVGHPFTIGDCYHWAYCDRSMQFAPQGMAAKDEIYKAYSVRLIFDKAGIQVWQMVQEFERTPHLRDLRDAEVAARILASAGWFQVSNDQIAEIDREPAKLAAAIATVLGAGVLGDQRFGPEGAAIHRLKGVRQSCLRRLGLDPEDVE